MPTLKFIIVGAGQAGRLVAEISRRMETLECVGFLDREPSLHGTRVLDIPILGPEDLLPTFREGVEGALPVMGDLGNRLQWFQKCRSLGFSLVNVIDPSVLFASDPKLGEGIVISLGSVLLTGVEIGDFAFIGSGVNILHDTTIGQNCVVGGGTTIGASVTMGCNVSLGVGVQVASGGIRIGNNVKAAAGSVILKDVPDNHFVIGNPARVIDANPSIGIAEAR